MEIVRRAVLEIFEVLDIEIVDVERHAEICRRESPCLFSSPQPRRMTIDEPVAGIGPAEIGADLDIPDLAAAALAVVVGVLALAVGADRAGIVGVVAQLADVLDHHVHAVRVALAQMAAAGVVGPLAAELDRAAR